MLFCFTAHAQYETVYYDIENSNFDNGQALPAETFFNINSTIPASVDLVEIEIYRTSKFKKPAFVTSWKRSEGNTATNYQIPLNYKLRRNGDYSFVFRYYSSANDGERAKMKQSVFASLDAYIDGVMTVEKSRIGVSKSSAVIVSDLDAIMDGATRFYLPKADYTFDGFSSVVESKIDQIRNANLKDGLYALNEEEYDNKKEARQEYADQLIDNLKMAIKGEAEQIIDADSYTLDQVIAIEDYPVQKTQSVIGVNIGYGGIFLDGRFKDFTYARGAYAGLSFPLGNINVGPKFFSNASVNVGVFLKNFEDEQGNTQTGPIVNRPIYAGLGYKIWKFIRINGGVVMVGESEIDGGRVKLGDVGFKPYVGLSLEFKLWAKLAD